MASASERNFQTFPRGHIRDNIILAHFRAELRTLINPQTGVLFTEDEIKRATAPGTRFHLEADAIDLLGQANQQRAIHFVQQIDPRRANTEMLSEHHGRLWLGEDSKLSATGAAGIVSATGTEGTLIPGSTTVLDPAAAVATDPQGLRFQNLATTAIVNGQALLTMRAVEGGTETRLPVNTQLTWSSGFNPGTDPVATVQITFDGGADSETDEDYSARVVERIRDRPASGNAAHFSTWAREASVSVERAFVYPAALNAGSVLVAITEKRANVEGRPPEGPLARVPSIATLSDVTTYLTPPTSPVVPQRAFVLVTGVKAQSSDLVLRLSLNSGRTGGWADAVPWPSYSSQHPAPSVASVGGSGLTFTLQTDQPLPNGSASLVGTAAPQLMIWNREITRWAKLSVASITDPQPGATTTRAFTITLVSEPELYDANGDVRATPRVHVGDKLSPYTDRAEIISEAIENYFDALGPGEVLPSNDPRYERAKRQPAPSSTHPARAGQSIISALIEALGGTAADAELTSISRTQPDLPTNIVDGPSMIVLGNVSVAPL